MKRILFVIYSLRGGGAEKVLVNTVNYLNRSGVYDISVRTLVHDETHAKCLNKKIHYTSVIYTKNRKITKIISGVFQYIIPQKLVYQLFFKGNYDIEIGFMEAFPTKLLASSTNRNAKKYVWVHTDLMKNTEQDRLFRSLKHNIKCYQAFDKIFCVSEGVKRAFLKKYGKFENVSVLYNILDDKEIRKKASNYKKLLYREKGLRFVTVGGLEEQKGADRIPDIAKRLKEKGVLFQWNVIGTGSMKSIIEEKIQKYELGKEVVLGGFQDNPYPYIKQADLYISPSRIEGFSSVVAEALILGVPVITTDCPGMKEQLMENRYGIIVKNNVNALAEGIIQLSLEHSLLDEYKQRAVERSREVSAEKRLEQFKKAVGLMK